jgi:hypothetical protein
MILSQKQTQRPMKQNRRPEIKPHSYSHMIFDKRSQSHTLEERQPLTRHLYADPYLSHCTKINSKWVKDKTRSIEITT